MGMRSDCKDLSTLLGGPSPHLLRLLDFFSHLDSFLYFPSHQPRSSVTSPVEILND